MMPRVTVSPPSSASALPIATTSSPTCTSSESPSVDGREPGGVDLEHREVARRRCARAPRRRRDRAVGEHRLDLVGALDHVVVGDDDAVGRDHEPGAGGATGVGTTVVDHGDDRRHGVPAGSTAMSPVRAIAVGRAHHDRGGDRRRSTSRRRRRRPRGTTPPTRPARRRGPPTSAGDEPVARASPAGGGACGVAGSAARLGHRRDGRLLAGRSRWRGMLGWGPGAANGDEAVTSGGRGTASALATSLSTSYRGSYGGTGTHGPLFERLTGRGLRSLSGYGNRTPVRTVEDRTTASPPEHWGAHGRPEPSPRSQRTGVDAPGSLPFARAGGVLPLRRRRRRQGPPHLRAVLRSSPSASSTRSRTASTTACGAARRSVSAAASCAAAASRRPSPSPADRVPPEPASLSSGSDPTC